MSPRERPIPFSDAMVAANRAGLKTVTRRVAGIPSEWGVDGRVIGATKADLHRLGSFACFDEHGEAQYVRCRYGAPGDVLWSREAWGSGRCYDRVKPSALPVGVGITYRTDEPRAPLRWRPPMFMMRWMSRDLYRVVNVTLERVQGITREDARAEGMEPSGCWEHQHDSDGHCVDARLVTFARVWDSLNAKRGYPFSADPWVFRVEYRAMDAAERVKWNEELAIAEFERDMRKDSNAYGDGYE